MIKINQLAGMNIHYLFYSLKEFFAYQQKNEFGKNKLALVKLAKLFGHFSDLESLTAE
ncbi:hypothetical protein [Enterococcus faecium]|uniref:hypothetical protein n=1 Tax=Enterococcus faecium TaxID=1352 RepID=UPI00292FA455|nr:hypothetical protein [Enterococcus faecium]